MNTPIVFLHAFPLSSAMWDGPAASFGTEHGVVRPDARGFGRAPLDDGPLTMDQIAEDALAALDAIGERQAIVCGCSMGGYAALAFARRFPERLRALVLVDTRATPDSDEARAGRKTLADKVLAQGASAMVEAMLPKIVGATTHRERPDVVARVEQWILDGPPQAIANALLGLGARPDARADLAAITVPTLIVRGEEDALISEADAEELHRGLVRSAIVSIPRSGHLSSVETPGAFDEALAAFLRGLS